MTRFVDDLILYFGHAFFTCLVFDFSIPHIFELGYFSMLLTFLLALDKSRMKEIKFFGIKSVRCPIMRFSSHQFLLFIYSTLHRSHTDIDSMFDFKKYSEMGGQNF